MPIHQVVQHVYQKSADGGVIFYSSRDVIVFFTIFCVCARKHGVRPTALCIMVDHTHGLYQARDRKQLSAFIREYSCRFSREFNSDCGQYGPLFKPGFGCAAKYGDKQIRSINAYVANNPVEKHICLRAEAYQWNFLAYSVSSHPFSEKLLVRYASPALRRALHVVKDLRKRDVPVNYRMYDRLCNSLCVVEKRQLADFIISEYSVIDYPEFMSYYKSYDGMLEAFANTKGVEYDINEDFDRFSNQNYARIAQFLREHCGIDRAKDVIRLSVEKRKQLEEMIVFYSIAPDYQVRKYLHLTIG